MEHGLSVECSVRNFQVINKCWFQSYDSIFRPSSIPTNSEPGQEIFTRVVLQ